MRLIDLARVAAEAEGVRLKVMLKRQARRGIWGAAAAVFALFFCVSLHLTAYEFLAPWLGAGFAALALMGLDLVLAVVFGILAAGNTPSLQEREAAAISRTARLQLRDTAATFAMVLPVARLAGARRGKGALIAAIVAKLFNRRR